MADWQATTSTDILHQRALLLSKLRRFFAERDVLEVETPQLGRYTVTDVHLQSFEVTSRFGPRFLQTSPEYAMKRLLASGSGPVYQICKAFRDEEQGRLHNPEFTMLEWYRPGFSLSELMDEVEALARQLLDCESIPRFTYKALFKEHLDINPHQCDHAGLKKLAHGLVNLSESELTATDYLQLLMHHVIEPQLPSRCFVYQYPLDQAALATTKDDGSGDIVANRFELYCSGMELANGYHELTDAGEQRERFRQDQEKRAAAGMHTIEEDDRLIEALRSGLPACAGVAMGVDRLLMLVTGADSIEQVISFPGNRA